MITPRKTSAEYWSERMGLISDESHRMTIEKEKELASIYKQSTKEIQAKIDVYYQRWADEQGLISKEEAKKDLSSKEFEVWKKDVKKYYSDTQNIADEQARKKAQRLLDGLALRSRISREQQLLYNIEFELMRMKIREQKSFFGHLIDLIQYGYNRMMYELSRGIGFLVSFATLPVKAINFIMGYNWNGANFSKRIWRNYDVLTNQVKDVLSRGFTQGKSVKQMAKDLVEFMDVGNYVSRRLIQTESNFVSNESTSKAMQDTGFIDEYIFIATYDNKTSKVCKHNNNKRFKWEQKKIGTNFPPLHPFCRSYCIGVLPNSIPTTRIAKDAKGENIHIPFDMSFSEYESRYLKAA